MVPISRWLGGGECKGCLKSPLYMASENENNMYDFDMYVCSHVMYVNL